MLSVVSCNVLQKRDLDIRSLTIKHYGIASVLICDICYTCRLCDYDAQTWTKFEVLAHFCLFSRQTERGRQPWPREDCVCLWPQLLASEQKARVNIVDHFLY